jgi:hypothetical protein
MYVLWPMTFGPPGADGLDRKFGKQIQKSQLEIPEYAASFVDYKALKKVCSQVASLRR